MHDFSFYRIQPQAVRYIGGFGYVHWVKAEDFLIEPYPLVEQEDGVIEHMNADHQNSLFSYCRHFHQYEAQQVEMLGIDRDGFDVRADDRVLRFDFSEPVLDAQNARTALVAMSQ